MATTTQSRISLEQEYAATLEEYLRQSGETSLHRAYELGRKAMGAGHGILDIVHLHHQAAQRILGRAASPKESAEIAGKAGDFFAEAISPFEMTNRAFGEANAALRRLNEILEGEAKRIALSLHDGAGQLLAAVHMKLDDVGRDLPSDARERLQEVRQILDRMEVQLRGLAHELRPPMLEGQGLLPAVEHLVEGFSRRSGVSITVDNFDNGRLPSRVETTLYRVIQEALNNATKHARAKSVKIQLKLQPGLVSCSIADDGIGFDPAAVSSGAKEHGLGLVGIRERLNALNGSFEVHSAPGRGTEVHVKVPLGA